MHCNITRLVHNQPKFVGILRINHQALCHIFPTLHEWWQKLRMLQVVNHVKKRHEGFLSFGISFHCLTLLPGGRAQKSDAHSNDCCRMVPLLVDWVQQIGRKRVTHAKRSASWWLGPPPQGLFLLAHLMLHGGPLWGICARGRVLARRASLFDHSPPVPVFAPPHQTICPQEARGDVATSDLVSFCWGFLRR